MSLQKALEILGFKPCYHFQVTITHYFHMKFWVRAKKGRPVNYKKFFRKYKATVDWPACEFYRELSEIYPKAKVLLNVRDPYEWYDSMFNTIWAIQPVFPWWFPRVVHTIHDDIIWNSRFRGEFENREKAVEIYKGHLEEVKKTIPAERLLVYNVKEGWKPLCDFLDVDIPENTPFPDLNDREVFLRLIRRLKILEWLVPAAVILALAMLFCVLVLLWHS